MKTKRVLIFYFKGFINSIGLAEYVFNKAIRDMLDEGREVKSRMKDQIAFTDGSKVYLKPFGSDVRSLRLTHLYIDEQITKLGSGQVFIREELLPLVLKSGNYENFDATESSDKRVMVFKPSNDGVNFNKFN